MSTFYYGSVQAYIKERLVEGTHIPVTWLQQLSTHGSLVLVILPPPLPSSRLPVISSCISLVKRNSLSLVEFPCCAQMTQHTDSLLNLPKSLRPSSLVPGELRLPWPLEEEITVTSQRMWQPGITYVIFHLARV